MDTRWPGVMRNELGKGFCVIEEGLNGRTTVFADPLEGGYKSGKDYLLPCLESHAPLDIVIIMLGTNDMKKRFSVSVYDIGKGLSQLLEITRQSKAGIDEAQPHVLVLAPPPFATLTGKAEMFEGAEVKSRSLAGRLQEIATEFGCEFFDTGKIICSSPIDGFHLEASEHLKLGQEVARLVHSIIAP
jgi:lysophospholipase L1-like esterase